jgi:hypothetical protein
MSKRWGEPTWYFFHTFIEKITDDFYYKNSKKCIEIYKIICNNLPCPICKEHANNYIKRHKIDNMTTRVLMKMFLFNFHNDVNKRLKKAEISITILEQYQRITISKAYQFFCQEFFKKNYVSRHFSGWIKNKIKEDMEKFMRTNICYFKE